MVIQVYGGDDSDVGSPAYKFNLAAKSSPHADSQPRVNYQANEPQVLQHKTGENGLSTLLALPSGDSYQSMGQILSSMDKELPLPVSRSESSNEKSTTKPAGSNLNSKRSTIWGSSVSCLWFGSVSWLLFDYAYINFHHADVS